MPTEDFQEVEADAFATEFLMPRWLILWHAARQGWTVADFGGRTECISSPCGSAPVYEAACWTLARHKMISAALARYLVTTRPRELKVALLEDYRPEKLSR